MSCVLAPGLSHYLYFLSHLNCAQVYVCTYRGPCTYIRVHGTKAEQCTNIHEQTATDVFAFIMYNYNTCMCIHNVIAK